MFDTFMGLPVHILVSHFTVVLIPLTALATIAVCARKAWREKYAGPLAAVNVVMLVLAFVTLRAGEDFKHRYRAFGDAQTPKFDHESLGKALVWIMLALAIVSVLAWAVGRKRDGAPAAAAMGLAGIVALLATSSIVLVTLTGHTGAKSHWQDFIKSSDKQIAKKKAQTNS